MSGLRMRDRVVKGCAAFTLVEIIIASLITAVVVGGTMAAFIAAARMTHAQNGPLYAEAMNCAQQKLERFRNRVAQDDPFLQANAGLGWQIDNGVDDLTDCGSGSESLQTRAPQRRFCVRGEDCDGAPGLDCFAVLVRVCWDGTACPAVGAGAPSC